MQTVLRHGSMWEDARDPGSGQTVECAVPKASDCQENSDCTKMTSDRSNHFPTRLVESSY